VIVPGGPAGHCTLVRLTATCPPSRCPVVHVRFLPEPSRRGSRRKGRVVVSVNVPPQRSPFVAMVNVAAAVGLNCTLLNSETPKLANVMVRDEPESRRRCPFRQTTIRSLTNRPRAGEVPSRCAEAEVPPRLRC